VSVGASRPVSVGADGLLVIGRGRAAYDADASFILNQKKGRFSAIAEARTPGLPENVRRLGDLRLECRVMVAIAKDGLNFVTRAAINTPMLGSDWCGKKDMKLSYPVEHVLDSARLSHGGRSVTLDLHGKSYMAPVGNRDWPDDALVALSYAASPYSNCCRKAANCALSSSTSARSAATSCSSWAVRPPAAGPDEGAASARAISISPPSSWP